MHSSIFKPRLHLEFIFFVLENTASIFTEISECVITMMCKTLLFMWQEKCVGRIVKNRLTFGHYFLSRVFYL